MAEGMDVDPAPVVRDKKRFEVKKVLLVVAKGLVVHLSISGSVSVERSGTMGMG